MEKRKEFIKYFIAGCFTFLIDFCILVGVTELFHINYIVSAIVGFVVGSIAHYLLSIYWIFSVRSHTSVKREFILFCAIGAIGLVLQTVLLYLFVELASIFYPVSKAIIAVLIFLFNYSIRKHLLFSIKKIVV